MVCLTSCCCCIPLKIGCLIIACLNIINNIMNIVEAKEVFDHLGPEDNEDKENKDQKSNVFNVQVARTIVAAVVILVSILVIFAVTQKIAIVLKVAACFMAGLGTVQCLAYILFFTGARHDFLSEILFLAVGLYFAAVWYSYGEFIEEESNRVESYITVYDNASGQSHVIPNTPSYRRQPMNYQPYGELPLQGPGGYSVTQSPYSVRGGQSPYSMQGGQSQNPYYMRGGQSPYSMQTPQQSQFTGGPQSLPTPNQSPYTRQEQISSSTAMPQPYAPSFWSPKNQ